MRSCSASTTAYTVSILHQVRKVNYRASPWSSPVCSVAGTEIIILRQETQLLPVKQTPAPVIELSPHQKSLNIEYAALDYRNPKNHSVCPHAGRG
ncbi:MAG: hypothetical protein MZV63_20325 [Marinilabiliales bacterium]|nr:hypothetical protein [Marinilabiliales bacterium]